MSLQQSQVPTTIIYTRKNGHKEVFIRYEELGHGGLATVYRVKHQSTNKIYAMKIISKQHLRSKGEFALAKLKDEIKIQKKLNHPNILRSKLTFSDKLYYYIVLEYCPGQSIREYLKKSGRGYLTEPETKKILRDVVHGLVYLHNHKIIHHDLKLENFIIDSKGRVKISDFGLATVYKDDDDNEDDRSFCGTVNYLSPEIIEREGNGFKADIWAIGVSAFIMLTGQPPFEGCNREVIFDKIVECEYHFPPKIFISPDAKKFIQSILKVKPYKRPTASDLLNFPFLAKIDREQIDLYKPSPPIEKVDDTFSIIPDAPSAIEPVSVPVSVNPSKENIDQNDRVKEIIKKIHLRANRIRSIRRKMYMKDSNDSSITSDESDDFYKKKVLSKHRNKIHKKIHCSHLIGQIKNTNSDDEIQLSD